MNNAIWLRRDGDYVVVLVETKIDGMSAWAPLMREHFDGPFSHIIEPSGIVDRIAKFEPTCS